MLMVVHGCSIIGHGRCVARPLTNEDLFICPGSSVSCPFLPQVGLLDYGGVPCAPWRLAPGTATGGGSCQLTR